MTVLTSTNVVYPQAPKAWLQLTGSASQLLAAFSAMDGCFALGLLYDNGHPVIAFQPQWAVRQAVSGEGSQHVREVQVYQLQANNRYNTTRVSQSFDDTLRQYWNAYQTANPTPAIDAKATATCVEGFMGGLMGVLAYPHSDCAGTTKVASSALASTTVATIASSVSLIGHYTTFLRSAGTELNDAAMQWTLYAPTLADTDFITQAALIAGLRIQPLHSPALDSRAVAEGAPLAVPQAVPESASLRPCIAFEQYKAHIQRIQDYIVAGDCYQINYTMPFVGCHSQPLLTQFNRLWAASPAPFFAYYTVHAPYASAKHEVLSCSPELFLTFSEDGQVITQPIKGTRPRSSDPVLDAALQQQLRSSDKDIAENIMIVDLLRNDLSKYALTGSVKTTQLCALHTFALVHHLVSTVEATLRADATPLDVLFAAFPGGSITGAPKVRAMQIIDQLETAKRGVYCGSIGYINHQHSGRFNIAIRTFEQLGDTLQIWAGGGITAASNAASEWQECLDKVQKLIDAVAHS